MHNTSKDPTIGDSMFVRILISVSVVVSSVVHYKLWDDGYKDIDVVGPLFLVNAVGGLVVALAVLAWRHWLPLLAAVGFGASTLIAFTLSTTTGGFMDVHETWSGAFQIVGAVSEGLAVLLGVFAILRTSWSTDVAVTDWREQR